MSYWVIKQTELNLAQFDKSMEIHYPDSVEYLRKPEGYYRRIVQQSNYLDAIRMIDWDRYIKSNTIVLDLGGGTGWLSAYLSKHDKVDKIYNLDSSRFFLYEMMPGIVELMMGKIEKIVPIEGLFSPLLFDDCSLDIVVVASSLHHAENLESLLKEIHRVLKKEGSLFILNETPYSSVKYMTSLIKAFISISGNTLLHRYKPVSQNISSSGFLYDPYLNDKAYALWYWKQAIARAGFSMVELIQTHLPTLKNSKGLGLAHFICGKAL